MASQTYQVNLAFTADTAKAKAIDYAQSFFPDEKLTCYGRVSQSEAEAIGLDTY